MMMMGGDIPPNHTLYISNMNDKVKKVACKQALYAAFSSFGRLLDVVVMKTEKTRGQAWVVFEDVVAATTALTAMQNMIFFNKPLKIRFAKEKSKALLKAAQSGGSKSASASSAAESSETSSSSSASASSSSSSSATVSGVAGSKRKRETATAAGGGGAEAEEVEDDTVTKQTTTEGGEGGGESAGKRPTLDAPPSKMLVISNIPSEVVETNLKGLFSQFPGLSDFRLIAERGLAFAEFESEHAAVPAQRTLNNFRISESHSLSVSFAKK